MKAKKPAVLVVGRASVIATATKLIPEHSVCSKLWLAGSVQEAIEHLDNMPLPDVVITTLHPTWHSDSRHQVSRHDSDLHSIVIASHALSRNVQLVVAVNDSENQHLLAELVLETMGHFAKVNREGVVFLSGREYHHGRNAIHWDKALDDGLHGGIRWSPRAPRKSI